MYDYFFFFFQAEDGIRDKLVTGVQTCALPISATSCSSERIKSHRAAEVRPGRRPVLPKDGLGGSHSALRPGSFVMSFLTSRLPALSLLSVTHRLRKRHKLTVAQ